MTTGERLVDISTLTTGTATEHFSNIQSDAIIVEAHEAGIGTIETLAGVGQVSSLGGAGSIEGLIGTGSIDEGDGQTTVETLEGVGKLCQSQ